MALRILTDVDVKIVPRMSAAGHPFTELHHSWIENGRQCKALSRMNYATADSPHNRAYQIQAFLKRQNRAH